MKMGLCTANSGFGTSHVMWAWTAPCTHAKGRFHSNHCY